MLYFKSSVILGVGKRPNQNYLPCGCKAMLRLNFNYSENALRITTLNDVHTGHEVTAENYARISAKVRKISPNSIDSEGKRKILLILMFNGHFRT